LLIAKIEPTKIDEVLKDFENEKNQIAQLEQKKADLITNETRAHLAKNAILQVILIDSISATNPSDNLTEQRDATIDDSLDNFDELDKEEISKTIVEIDDVIEENEDLVENEAEAKLELNEELNEHENEQKFQNYPPIHYKKLPILSPPIFKDI